MYGTNVYDIRQEFVRTRIGIRKIVARFIGVIVFLFFVKQVLGITSVYISESVGSFLSFNGTFSNASVLTSAIQNNQLIQSIVVFVTGLFSVFTRFFSEIKEILTQQIKK